jgi:hypothetical protein
MGSWGMAPRTLNINIARDGWPTSRLYLPGKEYIEEKDERAPKPVWRVWMDTILHFPGRRTRFLVQTARNLIQISNVALWIHWREGWAGPRASLEALKGHDLKLPPGDEPDSSVKELVISQKIPNMAPSICVRSVELLTRQYNWRFAVFWNTMPCTLSQVYRCFEVTFCLHQSSTIFKSSPSNPTTTVNRLKIYLLRKHFIGHRVCMWVCMIQMTIRSKVVRMSLQIVWGKPIRQMWSVHATGCPQASLHSRRQ